MTRTSSPVSARTNSVSIPCHRSAGTCTSASPVRIASAALRRPDVKARCVPSSPGLCARRYVPPTSGKNPMLVSGIAIIVRSVTMRTLPCAETPTPPPITTPSMNATYGFGKRAIAALSRYSSRQNVAGLSVSPALIASYSARMSPPAQSPRLPAPSITTAITSGSFAHVCNAGMISRTMVSVSAFIALGRLRVRRPIRPSFRMMTSGSVISLFQSFSPPHLLALEAMLARSARTGRPHPRPPIRSRAMIIRMISLVPSRI